MAVGLQAPHTLPEIDGITLGVGVAGIRKRDRADVAVVLCEAGTQAAACFTRNRFQAAPVTVAREHLRERPTRALVINSGNANAGTGEAGMADAEAVCRALAALRGCETGEVLPFSTGVIGQRLPVDRINEALPAAIGAASPDGWLAAAGAIMTTDTVPKGASRRLEIDGRPATLTGIVKGSGMIRPDMATMLAFVATDASVPGPTLQACLGHAVERSFHRTTVDGDTSTNDACVLLATGAGGAEVDAGGLETFQAALNDLCRELAQAVVRDGEGATKFVEIAVRGACSDHDALVVATTIAHSPLVKTALFASDANWGRILAAVGRAPVEELDVDRVSLAVNGCPILRAGQIDPGYTEERGSAAMAPEEITITVDLGLGDGTDTVWTSDLSHGYVTINAEYRT